MAAPKPNARPFLGYWKITHMDEWDSEYIDLVVPGFIEFDDVEREHVMGAFQFGTVSGGIHAQVRLIETESFIEWSWEGQNDNDPGCGRGWAQLVGNRLVGRIYIHHGDDSAFRAERQEQRPANRKSRRRTPRFRKL